MATQHKCLVTGGSGYFGSLLVKRLLDQGKMVRIFDLNDATDRPQNVEFIRGDIRDSKAVSLACNNIDTVYHCVAMVPLAKDKKAFWSVNCDGTRLILEAATQAGVRKVLYTSSSAVYGAPSQNPVSEQTPPNPQEEYGRAKLAAEDICWEYVKRGLQVDIIRPRTIMGHGRLGIMQILFEWIFQGKKIPILGNGQNIYQFIHADDLARACILAAEQEGSELYNIGTNNYCSMKETIEGTIAHAGTTSRVISFPMAPTVLAMHATSLLGLSPLGPYHALMYGKTLYFDEKKSHQKLGWTSQFSNVDMFCQSYDWYLKNRETVLSTHKGVSHHRASVKQGILKLLGWFL